ncbi:MAG: sulfotransferase [Leptolyngbyaceae cyanobacterium]
MLLQSPRFRSLRQVISQAQLFLINWLFTPLAGIIWKNWLHFLRYGGTSIPMRYWPRTLFTSGMATINSVIAWIENKRYRAVLEEIIIRQPVFIIGHHRSGTTHLWNLLSQDPQFAYPSVLQAIFPHTFLTYEKSIQKLAQLFTPKRRPQDNVSFTPDSPLEEERAICTSCLVSIQMARHLPQMRTYFKRYLPLRNVTINERNRWKSSLDNFARKLILRHGINKTLLFKSPENTARIKVLLELYPDAKFIHIHRNPYRVFQSTIEMEMSTLPLYAYQRTALDNLEDFVLWRYQAMYDAMLDDVQLIPKKQFVELAYDELVQNPLGTLEKVYDVLDLPSYETIRPHLEAYLVSISDYQKNAYARLSDEQKERIFRAWHRSFDAFGYPK